MARRLRILLLLYALYSAWVYLLLEYNVEIVFGFIDDLVELEASVGLHSAGARAIIEGAVGNYGLWLGMVSQGCTFAASVYYLIHAYRQARRAQQAESAS